MPSSAALTAVRHTPSKLVMRVRFPSLAPARWLFSIYCSSDCYLMRPIGRHGAPASIFPGQTRSSNRVMQT